MVLQLVLHQNMVFQALDFMMADTTMVDIMMAMSEFETNVSKWNLNWFNFYRLHNCLLCFTVGMITAVTEEATGEAIKTPNGNDTKIIWRIFIPEW